jgi:LmbE family N-acetylglucosaminyl deacetylase
MLRSRNEPRFTKFIMTSQAKHSMQKKTILAIGAHPDDIEIGAGGFIAKSLKEGADVHYIVLSKCETNTGLAKADLVSEARKAAAVLGVSDVMFCDFENTRLPESSREIRATLEKARDTLKPDVVICPSPKDPHQDHAAAGAEALRIFRGRETVLNFEIIRKGVPLAEPTAFVDITGFLEKKLDAIKCFKSQFQRSYFSDESYRALATVRGAQAGCKYAEAFKFVRGFL